MCELLGMSCNVPTDIRFSFAGLAERGGRTGVHRDGWGIAFYEGDGCRTFHDPTASCDSEIAKFLRMQSVKSLNVISHIRKATHGQVNLINTHPFTRELWGRNWAFAHNGKLKNVKKWPLEFYNPIGTTDSEYAFCWILDQIRKEYPTPPKSTAKLKRFIKTLSDDVAANGIFNMLLCDSRHLYCYCGVKLSWITRRAPFGKATLIDTDWTVDFKDFTKPDDIVTVVATTPLTSDEVWHIMKPGEFTVFKHGLPV